MDTPIDKERRNSRWTRDPVVDDGAAIIVRPTERDIEIFKLLARYRYLPSDYIHAFVGGNLKALGRRLNALSRKPNLYLARPTQQRANANANHRPLIYELDERGARLLRELGLPIHPNTYHRNFAHELMVAQIMASIELGTKANPTIRFISWSEILASSNTPKATRESQFPASIPVAYSICGERHAVNLTADARPFGLERLIAGTRTYLFFPGVEADCSTEPLDPTDYERSSIAKKFAAYTAVAQQGLYRSRFGFPNFLVPIIAPTETRMRSMMRLVDKVTDGRGSKLFLFKTFPAFTSSEKPPEPGGHMLTEPWHRAGFPPLYLDR
jgi:hypothetical protein